MKIKFRECNENERKSVMECVDKFGGHFKISQFSLFADQFNKAFIYDGTHSLNLTNIQALSIGLNIGKLNENAFIPTREFVALIEPTKNIFEIKKHEDALNFIKGQDITNFKSDKDKEGYKIYTEEKFNFEENAFIAIKYKDMVLGIGQFTAGKIINKISKREKLH